VKMLAHMLLPRAYSGIAGSELHFLCQQHLGYRVTYLCSSVTRNYNLVMELKARSAAH